MVLLLYYPQKPWTLYVCVLALVIGFLEHLIVKPENRIHRLSDQYDGENRFRFLTFPVIPLNDFYKIIGNY